MEPSYYNKLSSD